MYLNDVPTQTSYVTLVNRTSKPLFGCWNGKRYEIKPGPNQYPSHMAEKFRDQFPVMGSEDPYTLEKQYLLGIVELQEPIDPIEQTDSPTLQNIAEKLKSGEYRLVRGEGQYRPVQDGRGGAANEFGDLSYTKP